MADRLEEHGVDCPCCGARFIALVDPSDGGSEYIQDCEICCRPLRFNAGVDPLTGAIALTVAPEDE